MSNNSARFVVINLDEFVDLSKRTHHILLSWAHWTGIDTMVRQSTIPQVCWIGNLVCHEGTKSKILNKKCNNLWDLTSTKSI